MSDFHNDNYANDQQHLAPDLTEDYGQDPLSNLTESEQPWEQTDQTDDTQPGFAAEDYYSSGYGEMEIQSNLYGSDSSDLNNSSGSIQYDSVNYEQSTYSVEQTPFDNVLNTQEYNSSFWEQQYQEQSNPSYDGMSYSEQRSGHDPTDPTAEDLQKANDLAQQAHEEEIKSQAEASWGEYYEKYDNFGMSQLSNEYAAKYKEKAEDLQAEADKLRGSN